jgi:hypothetical protein
MSNPPSLHLESPPFMMMPITVSVVRPGVGCQKWDYVALEVKQKKVSWEWTEGKQSITFNQDLVNKEVREFLASTASRQSTTNNKPSLTVTIKYFENGGHFTKGDLVTQRDVELRNPLQDFTATLGAGPGGNYSIQVSYKCAVAMPAASIVVKAQNLRIHRVGIGSNLNGHFSITAPRVAGSFDVSFLGSSEGSTELGTDQVVVPSAAQNKFDLLIQSVGSLRNGGGTGPVWELGSDGTRALTVQPREPIAWEAFGPQGTPWQEGDAIHIVRINQLERSTELHKTFSLLDFQTPMYQLKLKTAGAGGGGGGGGFFSSLRKGGSDNDRSGARQPIEIWEEGLYVAVLALKHDQVYLPAAHALITVTNLARPASSSLGADLRPSASRVNDYSVSPTSSGSEQRLPQRPPPQYVFAPPPATAAASAPDESTLCVICRDMRINIKIEPCRHVCLCSGCSEELLRRGRGLCPMCRAEITKTEEIFLP